MSKDSTQQIVGIISENANNDGRPIANLLERYFPNKATYYQLREGGAGSRLENPKDFKNIKAQFDKFQPNLVIIIRDLDKDENKKERDTRFDEYCALFSSHTIHLLFVYMIEELVVIDLNAIELYYDAKVIRKNLPREQKTVDKQLKQIVGYRKSDMRDLADLLNKQILYNNYTIWKDFIDEIANIFDAKPVF